MGCGEALHIGALIIRTGFGVYYIFVIRLNKESPKPSSNH